MPASTTAADVLARQPAGVFLSNGPGDPAAVPYAVDAIGGLLGNVPVFGICLGHQLLGRALGADTVKLPFGHHGGNHPVRNLATGKVEITSQNHNFAVDADGLAGRAEMSHVNLNDGVCEGLRVLDGSAFSVQHHPEAGPGPHDSAYLFEDFAAMLGVRERREAPVGLPARRAGGGLMPKRTDIESILLIGAGPIVIGQACEFDYSGTQACKVLGQEGYRVILANSNPATIMTDPEFAAATYVEPLDAGILRKIIDREQPDAVLPTLGGQTALNLAMQLVELGAIGTDGTPELIGANAEAIRTAEDREIFKQAMQGIGLQVPPSGVAHDMAEAHQVIERIGLPVVIRPAFILGGKGTGIATTPDEFEKMARYGLDSSPVSEILIERSIAGWKEYELEVMRDRADNCVIICSIENLDPMGVHTGDSITVAPAQTLSDVEYQLDARRRVRVHPPGRRGDRRVERAVRARPHQRRHGHHRDEPACVALVGARLEGHRVPDRQDRRQARGRLHARRDPQRHHQGHPGQLRAHHRLRRHQGATLGVREVPRAPRGARHLDAVGRRGDGDRTHLPREPPEGDAQPRARPPRPGVRPGRGGARRPRRRGAAHPSRHRHARPARSSSRRRSVAASPSTCWPSAPRSTPGSSTRSSPSSRSGPPSPSVGFAAMDRRAWRRAKRLGFSDAQLGWLW